MNDKTQPPKNLAVALDIGTTKVVALAGYVNEYEKIEVLGIDCKVRRCYSRSSI